MKTLLSAIYKCLISFLLKLFLPCKTQNKGFLFDLKKKGISGTSELKIGERSHVCHCSLQMAENVSVQIGDYSRLHNVIFHIASPNSSVTIGNCCNLQNVEIWIEDTYNKVVIGDNVYIGGAHFAVTGNNKKITIGNDCMFSDGIVIRTGDSHAIIDVKTKAKINEESDVNIGEHVWIAQNATILKGTNIGRDSVVGCGAVISGEFESNSMIVGVPAKVVKTGVTWSDQRFI